MSMGHGDSTNYAAADPEFSIGGAPILRGWGVTNIQIYQNFQKGHEIEKIMGRVQGLFAHT